ncbi:MAG: hypothetical protein KFH98_05675 [Gemmatimonadetes bacterium]|nr:hypothetical protein [Gemmatimonadota bacterium]
MPHPPHRPGMIPVAAGVALGLAAALAGTRLLAALLFGVDPRDPMVFGSAALFLIGTALLATLQPAMRAARVSPAIAMRDD